MREAARLFFFATLICATILPGCGADPASMALSNEIQKRLDASTQLKAEHITLQIMTVKSGQVVLEMATGDRTVRQAIRAGKDILTDSIAPPSRSDPNREAYAAYFTKTNVRILKEVLGDVKRIKGVTTLKLTAATDTPLDRASDVASQGKITEALDDFRKLAEKGDPEAQYLIGQLYQVGMGVPKQPQEAVAYMEKSAAQGYTHAMQNLAAIYQFGLPGITPDQAKALVWYQKAADLGFKYSQVNLAMMYQYGQGVKKDYEKAREWFTKAADQDDPRALIYLGAMYENGKGAPKDFNKAIACYQKAAALDSVEGYSALAWIYAACEDSKFIDGPKALKNAEKAVSLIAKAPEFEDSTWTAYAAAQARVGQYDKAVEASQKAIACIQKNELYTEELRKNDLKHEREHLELYQKHQPIVNHPDPEDEDGQDAK